MIDDWVLVVQTASLIVVVITFIINDITNRRVAKREVYQRLEFASIDLFRFEIEHSDKTWRLYDNNFALSEADEQVIHEVENHATQVLNLFEMSIELHKKKIVDDVIFSTWVEWIHEIANYKNFQYLWRKCGLKNHYTDDLCELIRISANTKSIFFATLCKMNRYRKLEIYLIREGEL